MIIRDLIEQRPADTVALLAPGRAPLTYGALLSASNEIAGALSAPGIGAGDRLAIVLPNGPEMAAAFLVCANVCTASDDLERAAAGQAQAGLRAGAKLADFKVPRRIFIVAEIPKGATGKLQRIGLARKLGLAQ